MKKYKVSFYFGTFAINPFITPKVVEVEVNEDSPFNENEIIMEGLKIVGSFPRTYTAKVEEVK